VPLQTVCVRHEPVGPAGQALAGEALDAHTLGWVRRINESGAAFLTPAVLDGRWMVRVSFGSAATRQDDVEALWRRMQAEVQRG
jgi:aromatic-L-amino-acid decarboxylase